MKKTTKILLVLAAVVAMTIGAVSTVMAADVVIDPATWDCTDGWYAKDTNGNEIKNGWAVDPDGHWYYFYDGKALENEFLFWQGETYYFGGDCIMCEGWVKFLANEERNVAAIDSLNQVTCADEVLLDGDSKNPYGKAVWCYFAKGGAAASNEWIEDQGLWYYFEGEIMVSNNYMYQPAGEDVFYGFSGDGNMHVGWIKAGRAFDKEKPYDNDLSCWLYYNTDGSMANLGWKKIDNVWYYFVANTNHAYATEAYDVPVNAAVLLTNYFGTLDNGTKNFYLDTTGAMKTGAVTINSGVRTRTSVADCLNAGSGSKVDGRNRTFKFNSDGQKLGADGNNYYLQATDTSVFDVYNTDDKEAVVVTATTKCSTTMPGEKIVNAFRINGDNVNYFDANGTKVKNGVITIGKVTVAFDKDGNAVDINSTGEYANTSKYVAGRYYYFDEAFGTITVGNIVIPGCSTRKLSVVSPSAIN